MTQKIVAGENAVFQARCESYLRHLHTNGLPKGAKPWSRTQRNAILANIANAPREMGYPFPVKATVLETLHHPDDPEKSLKALVAVAVIAALDDMARDSFFMLARKWRADITMKYAHPEEWQKGESFIRNTIRRMAGAGLAEEAIFRSLDPDSAHDHARPLR